MNKQEYLQFLATEINQLKDSGLFKSERVITSPQQAVIRLQDGSEVINLCANNYLGLADDAKLIESAKQSLDELCMALASYDGNKIILYNKNNNAQVFF